MTIFNGIQIHESPYAVKTVFTVQPWPTKKRRKGYRVVREQHPCAYMVNGIGMAVHPLFMAKLRSLAA